MKIRNILMIFFIATGVAVAENPEIELKVCFIEVGETTLEKPSLSWQLDDYCINSKTGNLNTQDMKNFIAELDHSGYSDLIAAPKITTRSGSNATIKVVTEYQYPTDVDVRCVSVTNDDQIVNGVAVVPSDYESRDVGVILNVTPTFDAKHNMIDLELMAEIVTKPIWKKYTVLYQGSDGTKQTIQLPQPFFHTRQINPTLSLKNNTTVVMGGMTTVDTKHEKDKIPILGSIPLIGRLFCRNQTVYCKKNLLITITARTTPVKN